MEKLRDISKELRLGTENLVRFAGVKKGDNVLIFVDTPNDDPLLVQSIIDATEKAGGIAVLIKAREWPMRFGRPPRIISQAFLGADIIIGQCSSIDPKGEEILIAMKEYGANYIINNIMKAEFMASEFGCFPVELLFKIGMSVYEKVITAKRLRVTTPKGTDVSMGIHPRRTGGFNPRRLDMKNFCVKGPGDKEPFPVDVIGVHPEGEVNGVIYAEAIFPGLEPPTIMLKEPLFIQIENHWATEIKGQHADWLIETLKGKGDNNARWLGECMWGIHPKAEPFGWPDGDSMSWFWPLHGSCQTLHFALGRAIGGGPYSKIHADFYVHKPTIYLDGEILVKDGYMILLGDPEIHKIAKKYGDTENLLAIKPLPKGLFI